MLTPAALAVLLAPAWAAEPSAEVPAAGASESPTAPEAAAPEAPSAEAGTAQAPAGPPPARQGPPRRPPPGVDTGGRKYKGPRGAKGGDGPDRPTSPISPVALLQLWGTAYDMDESAQADATGYGDPEDDIGFKIKRGRVGLKYAKDGFDAALVAGVAAPYDGLDDENGDFSIYDAHLGYTHQGLGVQAGRVSVPFSRDAMMASGALTFQERGLAAEHVAPYRALGVTGSLDKGGFGVKAGVYNSDDGLFGDDNAGKTFAGRLEYTYGDRDTYQMWTPDEGGFALGVGGGAFYTMDVSTSTLAVGGDLLARAGALSVLLDGSYAMVNPTNTDVAVPDVWESTSRLGFTGQVSVGVGDWEPAVRASYYSNAAIGSWTQLFAGVVWHGAVAGHEDVVRIGAGYEMRLEGQGAIANDTARLWAQFWLPGRPGHHGPMGGPPPGAPMGGPPPGNPPGPAR